MRCGPFADPLACTFAQGGAGVRRLERATGTKVTIQSESNSPIGSVCILGTVGTVVQAQTMVSTRLRERMQSESVAPAETLELLLQIEQVCARSTPPTHNRMPTHNICLVQHAASVRLADAAIPRAPSGL